MWEFHICIESFQQVQEFVALANEQPFDISVGNERQDINGKDLMGMFSLDFSRPLSVKMHCSEEQFRLFRELNAAILYCD